jgi:6-phosphogluconate dehydrogenase
MNIAVIGLGRMGSAVAYRLVKAGYHVTGFDLDATLCAQAHAMGVVIASNISACIANASLVWLMVPAGQVVDAVLRDILPHVQQGAIIVDGGNSKFTDSQRRAQQLAQRGLVFLDCGTSGGVHGKEHGFSLMVGGDKASYDRLIPVFTALAAPEGFGYVGPSGAGHYVKMVHNGIEYALMQSYAEGLQLIKDGSFKEQELDLYEITRIWNHGAVIRSWLLELTQNIMHTYDDAALERVSGAIEESGTGQWTVQEAQAHNVPVKLIEDALAIRAQSRATGGDYATKLVALMRNAFGGHAVGKQFGNNSETIRK